VPVPVPVPCLEPLLGAFLRVGRGSFGDNSILGDTRWGGLFGVDTDFVANENCKICCISAQHVAVR
jgi:hypothetical protein